MGRFGSESVNKHQHILAKTRIFQIAKKLNISPTDILSFLKNRKIQVSSHMSSVDESFKGAMWELDRHKLYAKMINLNQDWDEIHSDILNVINE